MANVRKNLIYLTFSQAVSYLFPLLTLPYLSHKLTPEQFGVLGVCQAVVQYFMLVTDYGFNITATRNVSLNRDDKTEVSKIFSATLAAKIFLLLISFVGLYISWLTLKTVDGYGIVLLCCFTGVVGNAFYPLWLFQGTETMKIPVLLTSFSKLLLLLGIFVFVNNQDDLNVAALLLNAGNLIAGVFGLLYIRSRKLVNWHNPKIKEIYNVLMEGWPVFISTVAISFYTTFNTVYLSYKTDVADIGYYNAADKIRIAVQSMFGPITQAFYPRIVHLYKHDRIAAFKLSNKGLLLMLTLTVPAAILIYFFSEFLVVHYLNATFLKTADYLKLLSFLPVIIGVATIYCNWGLLGYGYGKLVGKIYIVFGLIHFLYAIPLISFYKVPGLILSVYITQLLITVVTVYYYYLRVYRNNGQK